MSEKNEQEVVQIRLPPALLKKIDLLIKNREFTTRSEFFKRITTGFFSDSPERLLKQLQCPEVQAEICKIVSSGLYHNEEA